MVDNPRIEELKRRVQSDPASIAFAALAEEYRRAGQYEEAIATCKAGLQRHPAYLSAHVTLGRALMELTRFDEARQELEHVLKAAPENLAAIRGLAEIHHRRGELREEEHYIAALEAARRDAAAHAHEAIPHAAAAHVANTPVAPAVPAAPVPVTSPVAAVSAPAAVAPPRRAVQPVRLQPPAPPSDPALEHLEAFLGAIVRARQHFEAAADGG